MYLQKNNISDCVCNNNGLGDYLFKGVVTTLLGQLNEESIEAIVSKLRARINYNQGITCQIVLMSDNCFRDSEIENILMTYANMVLRNEVREYTRDSLTDATVSKAVSQKIPTAYWRVQKVLQNLHDAVIDGTIKGSALLRPKTSAYSLKYYEIPPEFRNLSIGGGIADYLTSLGKWLLIGGGVLLAGYIFVPIAIKKIA